MPSDGIPPPSNMRVGGYTITTHIGSGTSGQVYRARAPDSADDVAIKIIPAFRVGLSVRREVQIHHSLLHPNVVQLHEVLALSSQHSSGGNAPLALVMELCSKGDLFDELAGNGVLPPSIARRRLRDIARGLRYMHTNGFVHGDLKLENVDIDSSGIAKLIDFGCSRRISGVEGTQFETFGGTVQYLAPEMIPTMTNREGCPPTVATDLWALGVILYTCMAGSYPFDGQTRASMNETEVELRTRHNIMRCPPAPFPSSITVPRDLQTLIDGLLQKDPAKRMTLDEVIAALAPPQMRRHHPVASPEPSPPLQPRKGISGVAWPGPLQRERTNPERDGDESHATDGGRRRQSTTEVLEIVDKVRLQRMTKLVERTYIFSDKTAPQRQNVASAGGS